MRTLLGCLILLLAAIQLPVRAAPRPDDASPSALCERAILHAERAAGTPVGMLSAIGQVESGRPDARTGLVRPWPWTIDANGAGQFFATKEQAVAAVAALQAQGVRSIDVGCMQVNLMQHPDAFASLDQAFDPAANATYAVHFLTVLYDQTNNWFKSIAFYHSQTPEIGADYQRRVMAIWRSPQVAPPAPPPDRFTRDASGGLIYGPLGTTGRVFGLILPKAATPDQ